MLTVGLMVLLVGYTLLYVGVYKIRGDIRTIPSIAKGLD